MENTKVIFVNSMSDLFHEDIPLSFIHDTFSVMQKAHWHTFPNSHKMIRTIKTACTNDRMAG